MIGFCKPPYQSQVSRAEKFSETEVRVVRAERTKILEKQVIIACSHESGEYISPTFCHESVMAVVVHIESGEGQYLV